VRFECAYIGAQALEAYDYKVRFPYIFLRLIVTELRPEKTRMKRLEV
jgi:hypothetical protein